MKELCCVIGFYKVVRKLLNLRTTAGRRIWDAAVYREKFCDGTDAMMCQKSASCPLDV